MRSVKSYEQELEVDPDRLAVEGATLTARPCNRCTTEQYDMTQPWNKRHYMRNLDLIIAFI